MGKFMYFFYYFSVLKLNFIDVREALAEKRTEMRAAERSLAKVVRHLTAITTSGTRRAEEVVRAIDTIEFWRWILFLSKNYFSEIFKMVINLKESHA